MCVANREKQDSLIAVLVINWNSYQDTLQCLESLYASKYPEYRVIVLDNGSQDESVNEIGVSLCEHFLAGNRERIGNEQKTVGGIHNVWVYSYGSRAFLLSSSVNRGFCTGCNMVIDFLCENEVKFDYAFLLNNDAIIESSCLEELARVAGEESKASVFGALVKNFQGGETLFAGARFPRELFFTSMTEVPKYVITSWSTDRVEGSAMLISRKLLEERRRERGYCFDPDLFLYGEDAELCFYARSRGYKVMMAGNAVVYHRLSQSSGGGGSALSYYYITRNRIRLASYCLSAWEKVLFHIWYPFSRIARALQRKLQGKPEVAMAILNGLWDGYSGKTGKWGKHMG